MAVVVTYLREVEMHFVSDVSVSMVKWNKLHFRFGMYCMYMC